MMAMNFGLDRAKWKALPRRLKIVAFVIVGELAIILGLFLLDDVLDEEEAQVVQFKSELTRLRQQNIDLRRQVDQYPELRQRYSEAMSHGLASAMDSLKLVNDASGLASRFYVTKLAYKIEPEAPLSTAYGQFRLGSTMISFESGALLDSDAISFWDDLLHSVPPPYHVIEATLERTGEIDATLLNEVRAGRPAQAVHAKLVLERAALRPANQEGP